MEGLPWPAITAASGGWVLFGWLAWRVLTKLTNGDLITRREADAKDQENAALRAANAEQGKQLSLLLSEALPTTNAVLQALHRAAEEMS